MGVPASELKRLEAEGGAADRFVAAALFKPLLLRLKACVCVRVRVCVRACVCVCV